MSSVAVVGCAPLIGFNHLTAAPAAAAQPQHHAPLARLQLGAAGTPANRFDVDSTGLRPGDVTQRALDVEIKADKGFSLSIAISVTRSSLLDQDARYGIQITLDRCDVPWIEQTLPLSYRCPGRLTTLLAEEPLQRATKNAAVVVKGAGADRIHLRMRLRFPDEAPNAFQGKTSVVRFDLRSTSLTR